MVQKLARFFGGVAEKEKGYSLNMSDDKEATVYLYGGIGSFFGVETSGFAKDIGGIDASTIHLRINSPGGDILDARAIMTTLQQHPAKIISHIDGLAASAATVIALAAEDVRIAKGGFFMIHNAWSGIMGNAHELREMAEVLEKIDATIVAEYVSKTGAGEKQVKEWMAAETWFSAEEALEQGFVNSVFDAATSPPSNFNLTAYQNTPKELLAPAATPPKTENVLREHNERRLRLLEMG